MCQSLGIKQGGPPNGKWAELPITKSPKIMQYSVGHEGQHCLLVAEDSSVFFVGTPKRGEDGDASLCKYHSTIWARYYGKEGICRKSQIEIFSQYAPHIHMINTWKYIP